MKTPEGDVETKVYASQSASRIVLVLLSLILVSPPLISAQSIEELTDDEILDFDFQSGIYSFDLTTMV